LQDEFYNLAQKKVGNKTGPDWGIKLDLDKGGTCLWFLPIRSRF
jgi:hypothetical protein